MIHPAYGGNPSPSRPAVARAWAGRAPLARGPVRGGAIVPAGRIWTEDGQPAPVPVQIPVWVIFKNYSLARKRNFFFQIHPPTVNIV